MGHKLSNWAEKIVRDKCSNLLVGSLSDEEKKSFITFTTGGNVIKMPWHGSLEPLENKLAHFTTKHCLNVKCCTTVAQALKFVPTQKMTQEWFFS